MSDAPPATTPYQVLARKHRPLTFDTLIGQEAMVRTLRNAFESDRIAHAFILTGVRGVGKTTTARIIAKGLNCVGPNGTGGPTTAPCGVCEPCQRIAEGRFIDVLEIDAASHTGVDFIRDINDMARTQPSARFKIFVLDEVHMLSTSAFNALLKTLEEPPPHVKFIFATTEIRKVPVTVLSRCQRFDLRRIEPEVMTGFLRGVLDKEGARVADDALALIVRAAEGSVRDALSLLDQAIAHGGGETSAEQVRSMLGLADRGRVIDLFDLIMAGDAAGALTELGAQYADGADPSAVLRDLAELTHWISVVKISASAADDPTVSPSERDRGRDLAGRIGMRNLARTWQMLLKALDEVARAPNAMMAAEMAVIRLTHVADLPSPEDLVRRLTDAPVPAPRPAPVPGSGGGGAQVRAQAAPVAVATSAPHALAVYDSFEAVVALARERRDMKLVNALETHMRIVRYAPGRIDFQPTQDAPADLAGEITQKLAGWTGARWMVSIASDNGAPTIAEVRREAVDGLRAQAAENPLVMATLALFPGAAIKSVRPLSAEPEAPPVEAHDDDDWAPVDPFDEE